MDKTREFLRKLGLLEADGHGLPASPKRRRDAAASRAGRHGEGRHAVRLG